MRKILTRDQYLDTIRTQNYTKYTDIPKANEAFTNDVNWGDSWVGRMINSIARKVKISYNLRRISGMTKLLTSLFDGMVESGKIVCDESTKLFIETKYTLNELAERVDSLQDEDGIDEIIGVITTLKLKLKKASDADDLIKALEEFEKFLLGLKKDKLKSGDVDVGRESVEGDLEENKKDPNVIFYNNSRVILQSIVDLHESIKNNVVRFKGEEHGKTVNAGTHFNIEKFNGLKSRYEKAKPQDKLPILRQLVQMCEDGLDSYKAKNDKANINLFTKYFKDYSAILSGMERDNITKKKGIENKSVDGKMPMGKGNISPESPKVSDPEDSEKTKVGVRSETLILNYVDFLNEAEANVEGTETDAKNAWKKVVNAYNQSGIAKFIPQIQELLSISSKNGMDKYKSAKSDIISICSQVIKNKKTIGNPIPFETLISEQIDTGGISKSISLFGRILLSFKEDIGLTGAYGSAINPLKAFIESFSILEENISKIGAEKKPTYNVGDTVVYKMNDGGNGEKKITKIEGDKFSFLGKDGEELSKPISDIVSKKESYVFITEELDGDTDLNRAAGEKFDELFDPFKDRLDISDDEADKIKKSGGESETIIIENSDPIIEIVRIFNRAWRIHTPGRIPSGRTAGKVSSLVFSEYEDLGTGGGSPEAPGNGPYRNIELYEKWQEAVLSILGNTKYRTTIFSENAKFMFVSGSEQGGDRREEVAIFSRKSEVYDKNKKDTIVKARAKPLGKILLKFINKLLSDTTMYKGGALPTFVEEYFGISKDDFESMSGNGLISGDSEKVKETADDIILSKVEFIKSSKVDGFDPMSKYIIKNSPKNMIVRFKNNDKYVYLYYIGKDKNKSYFYSLDQFYVKTEYLDISKLQGIFLTEPKIFNLISVDMNVRIGNSETFKYDIVERIKEIEKEGNEVEDKNEYSVKDLEVLMENNEGGNSIFLKSEIKKNKNMDLNKILKKYPNIK